MVQTVNIMVYGLKRTVTCIYIANFVGLIFWSNVQSMLDAAKCSLGIEKLYASEHDDIIKWKYLPRSWPFVWGIHRSPANSLHKGQWRRALMFSLICIWINGGANNREAGYLRHHCAHYDVTVMTNWQILNVLYCDRSLHVLFMKGHGDLKGHSLWGSEWPERSPNITWAHDDLKIAEDMTWTVF